MKVIDLDPPLFAVYADPNGNGYYAISDESPIFCIHAPSFQTLGLRVKQVIDFHEKRKAREVLPRNS